MRAGLDALLADPKPFHGRKIGLCINHTAVSMELQGALPALQAAGLDIVRVFGPEHGVHSTAQDMVGVGDGAEEAAATGPDVVSLYGENEASLHPDPATLADLDVLIFDIQDIGSRYYTYQATLGYIMEVAGPLGVEVVVLDRPNPIDGVSIEGNVVNPGFESFVSAYPLAVRHGMTMGEMGHFFRRFVGIDCPYKVIPCEGWHRDQWQDQTGLPWVYPSPNMPTLETAAIYPGMCLIEGTNLSEGRGTTRPFHLIGAPWLDHERFTELCRRGALDAHLEGVGFRAACFEPRFQKHAGEVCGGTEIFVTDRNRMEPFLLGMVVMEAALRADPEHFAWRTETYEFVDAPIAIDLLGGSTELRAGLETRMPLRDITGPWADERSEWEEQRAACLLY